MPKSITCLNGTTTISIEEALNLHKRNKAAGVESEFLCVECKERVKPHGRGGKVEAHFEHFENNPDCSLAHRMLQRATNDAYHAISWDDGYTDLLPVDWFRRVGQLPGRTHDVHGPSVNGVAQCDIEVRHKHALLQYRRRFQRNVEEDWYIGTMRLEFTNETRQRIGRITWADEGTSKFFAQKDAVWYLVTDADVADDEVSSVSGREGKWRLATHKVRERDADLRKDKINAVLRQKGAVLACEVCSFVFAHKYKELGEKFCEVHHLKQLAVGGERDTRLTDLAILCANCHRMIHKTSPMLGIHEFKRKHLVSRSKE